MTYAKLISVSEPKIEGVDTPDEIVAYAARISSPNNQYNKKTAPRLLKYLKAHSHWSPFEMAHVVLEVETTRDIARQLLRHRSFSFQEFSQRYASLHDLGRDMFVTREARLQDTKNRQNSIETDNTTLEKEWLERQESLIASVQDTYEWALASGIAKEQARAVLPEGLTKSRLYVAGSLRSWIHYCDLRMGNGTQKEHRELAELCWQVLIEVFPSLKEEDRESS